MNLNNWALRAYWRVLLVWAVGASWFEMLTGGSQATLPALVTLCEVVPATQATCHLFLAPGRVMAKTMAPVALCSGVPSLERYHLGVSAKEVEAIAHADVLLPF